MITWLKDDLKMIGSPAETEKLARQAAADDCLYLVPAFSGLGAPYWDSRATGMFTGMTRTTGRAEMVRAGLECIAYQIRDVVEAMSKDAGVEVGELRVDGGPTKNEMKKGSCLIASSMKTGEAQGTLQIRKCPFRRFLIVHLINHFPQIFFAAETI